MKRVLVLLAVLLMGIGSLSFADSFLQLSLTPEIALRPRPERIKGLTIGIWGENPQNALAIGIIQGAPGDSSGFSWAVINYAGNYTGVQWGGINYNSRSFTGWQSGFINYTDGRTSGLQTGTVNYASRLKGVQIGLLNYADRVDTGLQLGMINVIPQNEVLSGLPRQLSPAMVFANWSF